MSRLRSASVRNSPVCRRSCPSDRTKTRISQYLRGEDLTLETIAQIASVLECSIDYLSGRSESPTAIVAEHCADSKRERLVRAVNQLANSHRDDDVIDGLLKIVERLEK
jgi:transcriptional regulator with XRE-family HTH domain